MRLIFTMLIQKVNERKLNCTGDHTVGKVGTLPLDAKGDPLKVPLVKPAAAQLS